MLTTADVERFWSKVDFLNLDGCWTWTLTLRKLDGYGQFRAGVTLVRAHRFSYEATIGPIPRGLVLDHRCRNRACVRPDHLEPVTIGENTIRGMAAEVNRARFAARTHCKSGHEMTAENTNQRPDGRRRCRACVAAWNQAYRDKQKVAT